MWHIEIQKVQFEDIQKSAQEKAMVASRCLQAKAIKQLRQEEVAMARRARVKLLRTRQVPVLLLGIHSPCSYCCQPTQALPCALSQNPEFSLPASLVF